MIFNIYYILRETHTRGPTKYCSIYATDNVGNVTRHYGKSLYRIVLRVIPVAHPVQMNTEKLYTLHKRTKAGREITAARSIQS